VVLLAEVVGFEMRVSESQKAEDLDAIGDDALYGRAPFDDRPGRAPLELVQKALLHEAIDLFVIEDFDLNVRREPLDVGGELGALCRALRRRRRI
jgi:hypothetical protein